MDINDCIVFLLSKNSQAGYRLWNSVISHLNLTTVQAMVLIIVNKEQGLTAKEIGKQTHLDSATITGILDRLENMDLISKKKNPKDRRAILVYLTKKGKEFSGELDSLFEEAHQKYVKCLSPEEEFILRGLLKRLFNEHKNKIAS